MVGNVVVLRRKLVCAGGGWICVRARFCAEDAPEAVARRDEGVVGERMSGE